MSHSEGIKSQRGVVPNLNLPCLWCDGCSYYCAVFMECGTFRSHGAIINADTWLWEKLFLSCPPATGLQIGLPGFSYLLVQYKWIPSFFTKIEKLSVLRSAGSSWAVILTKAIIALTFTDLSAAQPDYCWPFWDKKKEVKFALAQISPRCFY